MAEGSAAPRADTDLAAEQAKHRAAAAERRRRRRWREIAIRLTSLAVVLSGWEFLGGRLDPVLFTTPTKIAAAAAAMLASGELWN